MPTNATTYRSASLAGAGCAMTRRSARNSSGSLGYLTSQRLDAGCLWVKVVAHDPVAVQAAGNVDRIQEFRHVP